MVHLQVFRLSSQLRHRADILRISIYCLIPRSEGLWQAQKIEEWLCRSLYGYASISVECLERCGWIYLPIHPDSLPFLFVLFCQWIIQSVTEISITNHSIVWLNVVYQDARSVVLQISLKVTALTPKVILGQLENHWQQPQESAVDRVHEILPKHELLFRRWKGYSHHRTQWSHP